MEQYIKKSDLVAEIEKRIKELQDLFKENEKKLDSVQKTAILLCIDECKVILSFFATIEVKEINNVWHNAKRTIPEDGNEQIICIKEDGLAVSTVGKIVNGTIKWAYLNDLLDTNNFKPKEVDLEKEISDYLTSYHLHIKDGGRVVFDNDDSPNFMCDIRHIAKHFYELGLNTK